MRKVRKENPISKGKKRVIFSYKITFRLKKLDFFKKKKEVFVLRCKKNKSILFLKDFENSFSKGKTRKKKSLKKIILKGKIG